MIITELFDKKIDYTWKSVGTTGRIKKAIFPVEITLNSEKVSTNIIVTFYKSFGDSQYWSVDFTFDADTIKKYKIGNFYGILGTGNQYLIFSTIIDIIKDFIKSNNPDSVSFSADEPNRRKLYSKLLQKFKYPGYAIEENGIHFSIKKEQKQITELFDKIIPYEWTYKSDKDWQALFDVKGEEYYITCSIQKDFIDAKTKEPLHNLWDLSFGPSSNGFAGSTLTNIGNEFLIFSTVKHAFMEFINTIKPEMITIGASREQKNRFPLYLKIIGKFKTSLEALAYHVCDNPIYPYIDLTKDYDSLTMKRNINESMITEV